MRAALALGVGVVLVLAPVTARADGAAPPAKKKPDAAATTPAPVAKPAPATKPAPAVKPAAPCVDDPAAAARAAAWGRLTDHAGLKVGGFALAIAGVRVAMSGDKAATQWATTAKPLGPTSVLGSDSPPFVLGGTALTLTGLALFAKTPKLRAARWRQLEIFAVTQAVTAGLTQILKIGVYRERPDGHDHLSFPSGHTSSSFAWATFIWRRFGWKWGLPAVAVASFVGLSRIQDDRHWLTDVLGGAVLGVSVTYVIDALYGPDALSF